MDRSGGEADGVGAEHNGEPDPEDVQGEGFLDECVGDVSPDERVEVDEWDRENEQREGEDEATAVGTQAVPDP